MFDYSKLPDGMNHDEWRRCLIEFFEIMDTVTGIIPRLGLKSVWDEILLKKESISNVNVVKLIEECDAEYGAHVVDPYWSYKNLPEKKHKEEKTSLFKFIKDKFN